MRRLMVSCLAVVAGAFAAPNASAQALTSLDTPQALNSLGTPLSERQKTVLASFQADPADVLVRNPKGGGPLMTEIRDVLVADLSQLNAVFLLVPKATADQQQAIGSGLALARLLLQRNPALANEIQTRVVAADNRNLLQGFSLFGGTGVASLGTSGGQGAPAVSIVLGPVGTVASAPAANSDGQGGSDSSVSADVGGRGGSGSSTAKGQQGASSFESQ